MTKDTKIQDLEQRDELFATILLRANRESFWKMQTKGQAHYVMNNEIASYSLYNSKYQITRNSELKLLDMNIDLNNIQTRCSIHSIRDLNNKKIFTYEHKTPSSIQRDLLKKMFLENGEVTEEYLHNVLDMSDVVIMLQSENTILRENGLNSKMPIGCDPLVNPTERYIVCNINISDKEIKMSGKACTQNKR